MTDLAAAAFFFSSQVGLVAGLAATAYVAGRLLGRRLPLAPGIERAAVAVTLGLAALAQLGCLLGLAGWLTRPALAGALAALHLAGFRAWGDLAADARAALPRRGRARSAAGALAVLFLAPLVLLALYPATAFDATLYHLPDARAFAAAGALPFLPHLRFPIFPQLAEVLFAGMHLLDRPWGDVGSQLVELVATLATAALLVGWAASWGWDAGGSADIGEPRAGDPAAGWLAAATFLGNPIVVGLGATAYVEPGLTLFAVAALHAAFRWRASRRRGWAAVAAACGGAAAASKYLGLFFLAAAGLAIAWPARRVAENGPVVGETAGEPRRLPLADLALFAAVALAVLLPWYGRIVQHTGNPVFPFLPRVFGGSPWQQPHVRLTETEGSGLAALLRLPWDALFARQHAGNEAPLSPAYLLALPLVLAAIRRDRRVRGVALVALADLLLYPLLPHDVRYLMPALPLLALVVGAAVAAWPAVAGRARRLTAVGLLLVLPGWAYAVYRLGRQGPVPATAAARDAYLASRLPLYPAVVALNRRCGERYTVYGFFAENMRYYAAGTWLGDWSGPERFELIYPLARDPEGLARRLAGFGAELALVPRSQKDVAVPLSAAWRRRFRLVYSDPAAEVFAVVDPGRPTAAVCGGGQLAGAGAASSRPRTRWR